MSATSSEMMAPLLEHFFKDLHREHTSPKETVDHNAGTLCQAKVLYEGPRKCNCCTNWVEQYPSNIKETAEETSDSKKHAIICRMKKSHGGTTQALEPHSIVIQSPKLKTVLGEVFAGYPGITTTLNRLEFRQPFWEFFYRWKTLSDAQQTHDGDTLAQVRLLLNELTSRLGSVHSVAQDQVHNNVITYDFLWTLFPPDTLVYSHLFNRGCLLQVRETKYDNNTDTYNLSCKYIDWDGEAFGWKKKLITISNFDGTRTIRDLNVYPFSHHAAQEDTQGQFLERGRKFVSLSNLQQKAYRGIIRIPRSSTLKSLMGWLLSNNGPLSDPGTLQASFQVASPASARLMSKQISDRIMVDAKAFYSHTKSSADLDPLNSSELGSRTGGELSERLLILCSPVVKAYALQSKRWGKSSLQQY